MSERSKEGERGEQNLRIAQLERDNERLAKALRSSQDIEAVAILARGIAHDMNNILASIMGLASIMKMDKLTSGPATEDLESIVTACARARELTKNLMSLSRTPPHEARTLSLESLVNETVSDFETKGELLRDGLKLSVKHQIDDATICGDPTQLRRVLINLCQNAADAIEGEGQITMETQLVVLAGQDLLGHPGLQPGPYVRLEVRDTGAGMEMEALQQACRPFFTTKGEDAAGLGLALVFGVVKSHQGRLTIVSKPESGTVVTIDLPRPHDDTASSSRVE